MTCAIATTSPSCPCRSTASDTSPETAARPSDRREAHAARAHGERALLHGGQDTRARPQCEERRARVRARASISPLSPSLTHSIAPPLSTRTDQRAVVGVAHSPAAAGSVARASRRLTRRRPSRADPRRLSFPPFLSQVEEMSGTFCFVEGGRGEAEQLLIFGHNKHDREARARPQTRAHTTRKQVALSNAFAQPGKTRQHQAAPSSTQSWLLIVAPNRGSIWPPLAARPSLS
eukprot:6210055-Pleurochrysis_carterae.AAC.2